MIFFKKKTTNLVLLFLPLRLFLRLLLLFLFLLFLAQPVRSTTLVLLLRLPGLLLFLLDALDSGVEVEREVDNSTQTGSIFLFTTSTLRLVFLLSVPLVITTGNKRQRLARHG